MLGLWERRKPFLDWQPVIYGSSVSVSSVQGTLGQWPHLQSDPSTLCSGSETCQGWKKKNLILRILDYVTVKSWPFFQTIDILIRLKESRIATLHSVWHFCSTVNWFQPEMSKIIWLTNSESGQLANWRKTETFQESITSDTSGCVDKMCMTKSHGWFQKFYFHLTFIKCSFF